MCMFANGWLFHTVSHWQLPFSFGQVRKKTSFQFPVFTKHPTEQSTPIFGGGRGILIAYRSLAWDWSPAPGPALPLTLGSGSDTGSVTPPSSGDTRGQCHQTHTLWRGPAVTPWLNYQTQDWFPSLSPKRYASIAIVIHSSKTKDNIYTLSFLGELIR